MSKDMLSKIVLSVSLFCLGFYIINNNIEGKYKKNILMGIIGYSLLLAIVVILSL